MKAVFELAAASVHFGRPSNAVQALSELTLTIHPGERVALVGANGCGKSTLLRLLHGLASATAGQVHCAGNVRQAMLFQKPHLMRMTVQSNIALGIWLRGAAWRDAKAAALAWAWAWAWALQPQVLLFNEPAARLNAWQAG